MRQKYNSIDIFNNSSEIYMRKPESSIATWYNVILITCFILCLISCLYEFKIFNIYYAKIINNDDNYVYMQVDEDFMSIKNRNYLNIYGEDTKCNLVEFSDNYHILDSKKYWEVTYKCELPDEINIDGNIIKVQVQMRKTTLFKELVKKIRRKFQNARIKN